MLMRIFTLIIKEMLAAMKDPKARFILLVPPLLQTLVFSYAATLEAKNLTLAVRNLDQGKWGFELVQRVTAARTFTKVIIADGQQEIDRILDQQKAAAVLSLPDNFSRNIEAGRTADLQLLLDGRKTNSAQIVAGYTHQIVQTLQQDINGGQLPPIALVERHWFNPNLDFKWYTVSSLVAILAMVIALLLTALSVAREREMGTFEQLLVSPMGPAEILVGKAVAALVVALVEGTVITLIAVFGFKLPFQGSILLLYGSMTIFLLASIGVGLFISSLSMTQQQGILGAFTFMAPSVVLSGFASPIENMPIWLQHISAANPLRWFLVIVRGIFLKDMPLADVAANTWPMVIIAFVTLTAAAILFRKRME